MVQHLDRNGLPADCGGRDRDRRAGGLRSRPSGSATALPRLRNPRPHQPFSPGSVAAQEPEKAEHNRTVLLEVRSAAENKPLPDASVWVRVRGGRSHVPVVGRTNGSGQYAIDLAEETFADRGCRGRRGRPRPETDPLGRRESPRDLRPGAGARAENGRQGGRRAGTSDRGSAGASLVRSAEATGKRLRLPSPTPRVPGTPMLCRPRRWKARATTDRLAGQPSRSCHDDHETSRPPRRTRGRSC